MDNIESVVFLKEYGHIKVNLKKLMQERDITRNCLSKSTGTRFEVISRWCEGNVEKLDLDILARICFVLKCNVSDIIEYEYVEEKGKIHV